ncbi:MAG TPA: glycine zipper 2TM domain-containing protein [Nevskiaceae bacterium]|nr:glycine zipper 2TM domain-containing protein [Nevskiaceae bacterium]
MKTPCLLAALTLFAIPLATLADIRTDASGRRVDCHEETVTTTKEKEGHPVAGTVVGAAAGAVIGHQFGSGHGNDAATAGGAVVGGVAGHEMAKGGTKSETKTETRCVPID